MAGPPTSITAAVQGGSIRALIPLLTHPEELFRAVATLDGLRPAPRFGVATTLPPVLAIAAMLGAGVGLGSVTRQHLANSWAPGPVQLGLWLALLGSLGIALTSVSGSTRGLHPVRIRACSSVATP